MLYHSLQTLSMFYEVQQMFIDTEGPSRIENISIIFIIFKFIPHSVLQAY